MAICPQFKKCGKKQCRCNDGDLHGPYYFEFFRSVDGRLKKRYIRAADAQRIWTKYSLEREIKRNRRADRKQFTELSRELRNIKKTFAQLVAKVGRAGPK